MRSTKARSEGCAQVVNNNQGDVTQLAKEQLAKSWCIALSGFSEQKFRVKPAP